MTDVDVLMVVHRRANYVARSLPRLLDSLPDGSRAWIWQNESIPATSEVIEEFRSHPRLYRFHHSAENQRLSAATNWLWLESRGALLGKVDDDCLMPDGWVEQLAQAHERPELGVIAAWHFQEEDLLPNTLDERSLALDAQRSLIRNCWVGGSGYLMKRECLNDQQFLSERRSFTEFCLDLAASGWELGWHYPLILQEHMDDPRSPHSDIRTDHDLDRLAPLSASKLQEPTVEAWTAQLKSSAYRVQTASLRPQDHRGWRRHLHRFRSALKIRSRSQR